MIRSVLLDFYNTIVTFDPPREELQSRACLEFGIELDLASVTKGYWLADDFMTRENAWAPIEGRSPGEAQRFWAAYESIILTEAGIQVSSKQALSIFARLKEIDRKLALFDDVIPTLDVLQARGITVGLVSNLSRALDGYIEDLGLRRYVKFALTSFQVGAEKPHPPIFRAALDRAGTDPQDTLHVGDQYHSDVAGARRSGIHPLLLDRHGFWEGINDCPRIHALTEILNHL